MNQAYVAITLLIILIVGGAIALMTYQETREDQDVESTTPYTQTQQTETSKPQEYTQETTIQEQTPKPTQKETTEVITKQPEPVETTSPHTKTETVTTGEEKTENTEERTKTSAPIIIPAPVETPKPKTPSGKADIYPVDELVKGEKGWIKINFIEIEIINKTEDKITLNITLSITLPNPCWKIKTEWSIEQKDKNEPVVIIKLSTGIEKGKMCIQTIAEDTIRISIGEPLQGKPGRIVIVVDSINEEKIEKQIIVDIR